MHQVAQLIVELGRQVAAVVPPYALYLVPQYPLDVLLLVHHVNVEARHDVAAPVRRLQARNLLPVHALPHVLVFEVPVDVEDTVVFLDVGEEGAVVEDAADGPVETVDAGVVDGHLLTG